MPPLAQQLLRAVLITVIGAVATSVINFLNRNHHERFYDETDE